MPTTLERLVWQSIRSKKNYKFCFFGVDNSFFCGLLRTGYMRLGVDFNCVQHGLEEPEPCKHSNHLK